MLKTALTKEGYARIVLEIVSLKEGGEMSQTIQMIKSELGVLQSRKTEGEKGLKHYKVKVAENEENIKGINKEIAAFKSDLAKLEK